MTRPVLSQVHELLEQSATRDKNRQALIAGSKSYSYGSLLDASLRFSGGLADRQLVAGARVGILLPKRFETVAAMFGTSAAGGTFVPINPILRSAQVAHIVSDCDVEILVTTLRHWSEHRESLILCDALTTLVLVDSDVGTDNTQSHLAELSWQSFIDTEARSGHRRIDRDMAAILYTSGSTGAPKGVVLSHRNLIAGAESVSTYLENTADDRILAALPLSFDAGLSQLTTAFNVGASVVLLDYLLAQDVLRAIETHEISGLAAVPTLWNQLAKLDWPKGAGSSLRYITNTGGAMPEATTKKLRVCLPHTDIFLMYGLTEAFRSTFLEPSEIDRRPDSIGKAIPNAEVLVVNESGEECAAGEPGELVHRGELVTLGYWNNHEATAAKYRPLPSREPAIPAQEVAVWSGDTVVRDDEGYLYFVARNDEMIKTSGYRVSPTEIEEQAYACEEVSEAVALGLPHSELGQGILLLVVANGEHDQIAAAVTSRIKAALPGYMHPQRVLVRESLPINQNGKFDRPKLRSEYEDAFGGCLG